VTPPTATTSPPGSKPPLLLKKLDWSSIEKA
jgi:hypothetical protein